MPAAPFSAPFGAGGAFDQKVDRLYIARKQPFLLVTQGNRGKLPGPKGNGTAARAKRRRTRPHSDSYVTRWFSAGRTHDYAVLFQAIAQVDHAQIDLARPAILGKLVGDNAVHLGPGPRRYAHFSQASSEGEGEVPLLVEQHPYDARLTIGRRNRCPNLNSAAAGTVW